MQTALTKSASVLLSNVQSALDEHTAALIESIQSLANTIATQGGNATLNNISSVFDAYQSYEKLTEEQKTLVTNYRVLEQSMNDIRSEIQTDSSTNISISGAPWYIGIQTNVTSADESKWAELTKEVPEGKMLAAFDINLTNYATGESYEPNGEEITVTMPAPDYAGYDGIVIVHQKSDGSIEYLEPTIHDDGTMTFAMSSFSPVGVLAYTGDSPLQLTQKTHTWIWFAAIGAALLVLAATLVLKHKTNNRNTIQ
jgi:hypothetical protein